MRSKGLFVLIIPLHDRTTAISSPYLKVGLQLGLYNSALFPV
jgi:hypothetical protein